MVASRFCNISAPRASVSWLLVAEDLNISTGNEGFSSAFADNGDNGREQKTVVGVFDGSDLAD